MDYFQGYSEDADAYRAKLRTSSTSAEEFAEIIREEMMANRRDVDAKFRELERQLLQKDKEMFDDRERREQAREGFDPKELDRRAVLQRKKFQDATAKLRVAEKAAQDEQNKYNAVLKFKDYADKFMDRLVSDENAGLGEHPAEKLKEKDKNLHDETVGPIETSWPEQSWSCKYCGPSFWNGPGAEYCGQQRRPRMQRVEG